MSNKLIQIGNCAVSRIAIGVSDGDLVLVGSSATLALGPKVPNLYTTMSGTRSDGVKYHLSRAALIFEIGDEKFEELMDLCGGEKTSRSEDLGAYFLPSADWLYQFHERTNLIKLSKYWKDKLFQMTPAGLLEEKQRQETKRLEKVAQLEEMGVPVNDDTLKLLDDVKYFDYTYAYIDEGKKWSFWEDRYKELNKTLAVWPKFLALFSAGFKK